MIKKECFRLEESMHDGKWLIAPIHQNFHLDYTAGSFNIICARLMNLSYANYLRFCRDMLGAELIGKNCKYVMAYFQNTPEVRKFVELLNNRANLVLWEREHPDWEEHQEFLKEHFPRAYERIVNK